MREAYDVLYREAIKDIRCVAKLLRHAPKELMYNEEMRAAIRDVTLAFIEAELAQRGPEQRRE